MNSGPSGWRITSIDTSGGPFSIDGHTCPTVLHPDETCVVRVRYSPSGSAVQIGEVVVRDDSYPGIPLATSDELTGEPDLEPFDEEDPDPTKTVPESTTTVLESTTTVPETTTTVLETTTADRPPDFDLSISPDPVQFDSAIVGSPAESRVATVTNIGDAPVTVSSVTLSATAIGDYSIALDGCTNTVLAVGANCALTVGFTPLVAGLRSGDLSVTGTGGTSALTTLRGDGGFDAQFMVTPEVVAPGQVATLVGSGFPPTTAVSVTLGDQAPVSVITDDSGAFMTPWLVLGGTPQGELLGDDVAVVGVYDAEPAPLHVVGTPMRPQATPTRSRDTRSHVSR